jgi:endo-1,4-beta-D-glucanase Y
MKVNDTRYASLFYCKTLSFSFLSIFISFFSGFANAITLLEHVEVETGTLLPGYTGIIASPFAGVAMFANGDGVDITTTKLSNAPGIFQIAVRGASNNTTTAGVSVYVGGVKVGSTTFTGATATTQNVQFQLTSVPAIPKIRFLMESDNGSNDTYVDWYELSYVGPIPPPPPAPVLPTQGAFFSGNYRNLFAEAGYSIPDINTKVDAAYNQLFHSTQTDRITGQAIFIADPTNATRAYIWDTGNNDVRTEGMSYGMMMAVQMNRQDDFNKLWAWANQYMLNTSGDMKGYFGWQKNTDGTNRDVNPAPDGEEYFVTALFMASHRWGDTTGIYNYKVEANKLLDNMYDNGQSHYVNGVLVNFSLFDKTANQILFSPYGVAATDPSYHLPAFYELWSRWATNNKAYWAQLAITSRALWKNAVNVTNGRGTNGLNPDYANFDGTILASASPDHKVFYYDAWRTIGNASTDFAWFLGDPWETTYAKTLHTFLKSKGISNYPSIYNMDGTAYNGNADHSPGLVGMNAMGAMASDSADAWDFVKELWTTQVPTGQYRYYDGSLYMFSLMAVSGRYKIYCPGNVVCASTNSSTPASSAAASSTAASSKPASSVAASSIVASSIAASSAAASSKPASSIPQSSTPASSIVASSAPASSAAASSSIAISAYTQFEAESYNAASGAGITKPAGDGGIVVNYGATSDWIKFNSVNFGATGAGNVNIRSTDVGYGANIEIYLDSLTGTKIATVYPNGGSVYTIAANQVYPKPTGTHAIYIKVTSANVKINWLKFLP